MLQRIVVVANRLPVRRVGDGWETSPGGLVSAVTPLLVDRPGSWVGWTGDAGPAPARFVHAGIEQVPVPLDEDEIDGFYSGFSNGTIWPLYHDAIRPPEFHRHWWRPYVAVNERYAHAAAAVLQPGDIAWIHDYQLQLVPGMLRRLRPDVKIGFFLHIPFPPAEIFARMPWRGAILDGLLGSDVIGFQTRLARHNFARAVRYYTPGRATTRLAQHHDREVQLQTAPISIDTERLTSLAATEETSRRVARLQSELGNRRIILGVDRLDYTKGIDVRLRAFDTLLDEHPECQEDVVFVQVAVPSRTGVGQYQNIRESVELQVGRINGLRGTVHRQPVHYHYGSLPIEELIAYYAAADVMCVTPLRDGMNLVAKEYVAARRDDSGVLVLSEFVGSAEELKPALLVNPYDLDRVADTLWKALHLPEAEAARRMRLMRRRVRSHTVFDWARACMDALT